MPTPAGALLVTCDKQTVPLTLPTDPEHRLALMCAAIRCHTVDTVQVTDQWVMWIDDEGFANHPVNPLATALTHRFGHSGYRLHGPVLITGDSDGRTVSLSAASMTALQDTLAGLTNH